MNKHWRSKDGFMYRQLEGRDLEYWDRDSSRWIKSVSGVAPDKLPKFGFQLHSEEVAEAKP